MTSTHHPLHAAVILCGCGRADGSEIHEATSILIHLARLGVAYRCFAPDRDQVDTVNHLTGAVQPEKRNCRVEAARIARGKIEPITTLQASDFDCLLFPGGFGAAKNLCTFARDGAGMSVDAEVRRVFEAFQRAGKPIGLCCIAPVIAAKLLGDRVTVTLGTGPGVEGVSGVVKGWGAGHELTPCTGACVDRRAKVSTSPAYMDDAATPWEVFQGIGKMVEATVGMCGVEKQ